MSLWTISTEIVNWQVCPDCHEVQLPCNCHKEEGVKVSEKTVSVNRPNFGCGPSTGGRMVLGLAEARAHREALDRAIKLAEDPPLTVGSEEFSLNDIIGVMKDGNEFYVKLRHSFGRGVTERFGRFEAAHFFRKLANRLDTPE